MLRFLLILLFSISSTYLVFSQAGDPVPEKKVDHQIHFTQPVKEIKHIMYDKSHLPIQGEISEDKKCVVLKNWEKALRCV